MQPDLLPYWENIVLSFNSIIAWILFPLLKWQQVIYINSPSLDLKANPTAIPEYLEKHFKQKEKMMKERRMMGDVSNDMEEKIKEFEERATMDKQKLSVTEFKQRKKQAME